MFIQDNIRDHHIADAAIERCSLTQDVNAPNMRHVLHNFAEHAISGHAQWIIDVEDDRLAPG